MDSTPFDEMRYIIEQNDHVISTGDAGNAIVAEQRSPPSSSTFGTPLREHGWAVTEVTQFEDEKGCEWRHITFAPLSEVYDE